MRFKSKLLLIVFLSVTFLLFLYFNSPKEAARISQVPTDSSFQTNKNYSKNPGKVANIFGWEYNRTSCFIEHLQDTIIFFYAEDQNIYYTYHSNPEEYSAIENLPVPQNPDFDVVCEKDNIYLTISDVHQQFIYFLEGKLDDRRYVISSKELIYDGQVAYNAVAPHTRIFKGTPYVVFMEYGRTGTHTPNSKVFVSKQLSPGEWQTTKLFEHPATNSQVLGVSLEQYQNNLYAFMLPEGKSMVITKLQEDNQWSKPKEQLLLNVSGHLEWQTLVDSKGILHIVFPTTDRTILYAQLNNNNWKIWRIKELPSINTLNLFEVPSQGVFLIYNTGVLRKVLPNGLSKGIQIAGLNNDNNLYFLRVPETVSSEVDLVWLEGKDGTHTITYKSFDLTKYLLELQAIDSRIQTETEQLVITN